MRIRPAFLFALPLLLAAPGHAVAPTIDSGAPIAYLIDLSSGAVLFERDAQKPMPPASMAKMMTAYVAFDMIKKGELKLGQKFTFKTESWKAWNNQGSTMFIGDGEAVSVENLLHGIITLSGNDACVTLAEGISGTEAAFAERMNATAKRIGLKHSHFGTSNGWPDEGKTVVTAEDLATLAKRTYYDFPDLYKQFYGKKDFTWNKIKQDNRDPLLGKIAGADGLKTGHTEEAGYGFTGSAEQNGRRLVMVVAGLDSFNGRIAESVKLMDWGFKAWTTKPLFKKGAVIASAPVQLGSARSVDLIAPRDLAVTLPAASGGKYSLKVRYTGPVKAPFAKGQEIAELVIHTDEGDQVMPLAAAEAVGEAGVFGRMWNGLMSLFS